MRLQELELVLALSYSARNEVFRPIAWRFDTGVEQRVTLGRNFSLELETTFNRTGGLDWARVAGQVKLFY